MNEAMAPVRYRDDPAASSRRQDDLNSVLIHAGYRITDEGKVGRAGSGKATTLEQSMAHRRLDGASVNRSP